MVLIPDLHESCELMCFRSNTTLDRFVMEFKKKDKYISNILTVFECGGKSLLKYAFFVL